MNTVKNISDYFFSRDYPTEKLFLKTNDEQISYNDAKKRIDRIAVLLKNMNLHKGDQLILITEASPVSIFTFIASAKIGLIPVVLSTKMPLNELKRYIDTLDPKVVILHKNLTDYNELSQLIPDVAIETFEHLTQISQSQNDNPVDTEHNIEILTYLLTSGTTGLPKAAEINHETLIYSMNLLKEEFWQLNDSDVSLMVAPFAHIFGIFTIFSAASTGSTVTLMNSFNPELFFETIEKQNVTFFAGVPMLANLLLYSPLSSNYNLSSLKKIMLGGSFVSPDLITGLRNKYDIKTIVGYGMTEGAPITYFNTRTMQSAPESSVGKYHMDTKLKIVNEGKEMPLGEPGEIWVKGNQMIKKYYKNTFAESFDDGWFKTGDVGRLDKDGNLFWLDRVKNMVKVSGYSVYPSEIETILLNHPAIKEVAVIGIPNPKVEYILKAFIVKKSESLTSSDIKNYCKEHLISYKVPRTITFIESLPKNYIGKIDKDKLRTL